jgi:hypothetical protein
MSMATLASRPTIESRSTKASLHQAIARGHVAGADHKEHHHERDEYQVQHAFNRGGGRGKKALKSP